MQAANRLLSALRTPRGLSFGAWQMLPGANHARFMARTGYDWICVDTEHGNIADGQMHEAVAAIAATGVSPIVRIAANESWMVKRALDAGAHGIIVPLLYTADDAHRLVQAAKFPPVGRRGFGSPFAMGSTGNVSSSEYLQQANEALLTIAQIETHEALENVEDIARVPGIDVLFIGPYDLGNNIGRPVTGAVHKDLTAAIAHIRRAAIGKGKRVGIYCTGGAAARQYADQGFHMVSVVSDVVALPAFLAGALETARG
ncbi:Pyruvate/Phosphoenolpyruvate kinase-like domain-containing protein [Aspergillus ambiguus]|uniref:HpcH/HpaI aldolase family protein n=1 Tax=Aspergillus ambiguus TaxID=176160 RepID=UPI003CCCE491